MAAGWAMRPTLHVLSAGAAFGLVSACRAEFEARHDCVLEATFAAAGSIEDQIRASLGADPEEPRCGVLVLPPHSIKNLVEQYGDRVAFAGSLGTTPAVLACLGDPKHHNVRTVAALRSTLQSHDVIYTGDVIKSTVGKHLSQVVDQLGLADGGPKIIGFPGGATAIKTLSEAGAPRALACAQLTEARQSGGVSIIGPLPGEYALNTEYALATIVGSEASLGLAFASFLTGTESAASRAKCGFEIV